METKKIDFICDKPDNGAMVFNLIKIKFYITKNCINALMSIMPNLVILSRKSWYKAACGSFLKFHTIKR